MDKSEKFWARNADRYDREEMKDWNTRMKILEKTKQYLDKQDLVLDFGCATGILANEIASKVKEVHGLDLSAEMVAIARRKAEERNIYNIAYRQTTLYDEWYKEVSYDVILGVYILHLLDDLPESLQRIYQLLKPGGMFISVTPCLDNTFLGSALKFFHKIGLAPEVRLFDECYLKGTLVETGFKILETEMLRQRGRQYYIVATKD